MMLKQDLLKEPYHFGLSSKTGRESFVIKDFYDNVLGLTDACLRPFVILSDTLPPKNDFEAIKQQLQRRGVVPADMVLVIGHAEGYDRALLWELIQTGIKDIYFWTEDDDFKDYIINTVQRRKKVNTILESPLVKDNLVGESLTWKAFLSRVIETALFSDCSFLLMGESGTGKELLSRLIHTIDTRPSKKDLVLIDCTTIVPELSGSEFFGHERGAYTNAMQSREGAFSLANRGTLFLDEIGELHLPLQAELLRVIQEGTYKKVGSNQWLQTSFRLVCATHRDLRKQVEEHKFRQDLFFRIADFEFHVPSLEERREDIPLLANFFLQQLRCEKERIEFDHNVMDFLVQRRYPGNVRELRQLLQRILLRHVRHRKITIGELPEEERGVPAAAVAYKNNSLAAIIKQLVLSGENYNSIKDKAGLAAFEASIEISGGNKQKAAERLGIDVRTVQMGLKKNNGR
jgi:transcriptional regulator with GAF, ATPase, and Fis domain